MVIEGTFREDLYFRLNVLPIRMPPLRERREDIPLLSDYFLSKFRHEFGKDIRRISSYAMDLLNKYDFPGNVRELENIIERGVALESSSIILPESLTLASYKRTQQEPAAAAIPDLPPKGTSLDQYLADIEIKMLQNALEKTNGVKHKAAELLNITFRSFRYRLVKYGMASEDEKDL